MSKEHMHPTFTQLAVATDPSTMVDNLYALDEYGGVWLYDWLKIRWEQLDDRPGDTPRKGGE